MAAIRHIFPTQTDALLAAQASRVMASRLRANLEFQLLDGSGGTIGIPAAAAEALLRVLDEIARGNAVSVIPVLAELTTQEAADLLNISRPTLIQLLNDGAIAYRKIGSHRRVRLDSLIAFKRRNDADRAAALAELAAYDQELGL